MKKYAVIFLVLFGMITFRNVAFGQEGNYKMYVFPFPLDIQVLKGSFEIDSNTFILIPEKATSQDNFLAGLIANEFADKYELPVIINRKKTFTPADKCILIGDITIPL